MSTSIRVRTGSRLHFGILSWNPDLPRQFGGAGVMIDEPGIELSLESARERTASGPLADRALGFARLLSADGRPEAPLGGSVRLPPPDRGFHIRVHHAAPEHVGLGTGTQLALAVARGVCGGDERRELLPVAAGAQTVGRGKRSAVGVYGFAHGGFLVEAGKRPADPISPLVARLALPDDWRFVVVIPHALRGLSGRDEEQAFARLPPIAPQVTEHLCRLVLQGLIPAAAQADFSGFSESLYEFNRRVGQCFAPAQGGPYAGAVLAEMIAFLRSHGCPGAGQSSWGPALFALAPDRGRAEATRRSLQQRFSLSDQEVICTPVRNHGAETWPG